MLKLFSTILGEHVNLRSATLFSDLRCLSMDFLGLKFYAFYGHRGATIFCTHKCDSDLLVVIKYTGQTMDILFEVTNFLSFIVSCVL
jgi:hypothetical protein